jgi:hypothetical protein
MQFNSRYRMAVVASTVAAAGVAISAVALQDGHADATARSAQSSKLAAPAQGQAQGRPNVAVGEPDPSANSQGDPSAESQSRQPTAARRYHWGRAKAGDDFRGKRLNRRNWAVYEGDQPQRRRASQVTVGGGRLRITGRPGGLTGGVAWMKGAQKRGRWEARVRLNRSCACYNANLLLWPIHGGGGSSPDGGGGEIDYMETYGDNGLRKGTNFFLHYGPEHNAKRLNAHVKVDLTKWHAFAVEWNARGITGFVDGRRWFHTSNRRALPPGPMGQAIQLDWFPQLRSARGVNKRKPAILEVDWIRMYRP